jgi:hypothetical protein
MNVSDLVHALRVRPASLLRDTHHLDDALPADGVYPSGIYTETSSPFHALCNVIVPLGTEECK